VAEATAVLAEIANRSYQPDLLMIELDDTKQRRFVPFDGVKPQRRCLVRVKLLAIRPEFRSTMQPLTAS
jgi:hypothetical protein